MRSILSLCLLLATSASALFPGSSPIQIEQDGLNTTFFDKKGSDHNSLKARGPAPPSADICSTTTVTSVSIYTTDAETSTVYVAETTFYAGTRTVYASVETIQAISTVYVTIDSQTTVTPEIYTTAIKSPVGTGVTVVITEYVYQGMTSTFYVTASDAGSSDDGERTAATITPSTTFSLIGPNLNTTQGFNSTIVNATTTRVATNSTSISVPMTTSRVNLSDTTTISSSSTTQANTSISATLTTSKIITFNTTAILGSSTAQTNTSTLPLTPSSIPMTNTSSLYPSTGTSTTLDSSTSVSTNLISTSSPFTSSYSIILSSTTSTSTTPTSTALPTPAASPSCTLDGSDSSAFYLQGMYSGYDTIDQHFILLVSGSNGDYFMEFIEEKSSATQFTFNGGSANGNCDLASGYEVANISPGETHTPLRFDAPEIIDIFGYDRAFCTSIDGDLACNVDGQSTLYVCPGDNPLVRIGSNVGAGCSALVLAVEAV